MKPAFEHQTVKLFRIAAAFTLLIAASAFASGRFTTATDNQSKLDRTSTKLHMLPQVCGDWTSETLDIDAAEIRIAEATGSILRRYTHRGTGDSVNVLLLCGPPGPISVHPPTACYQARGYRLTSEPSRVAFGKSSPSQEFRVAEFSNPAGFAEDRVGIIWCWTTGSRWSAPENPRLEFAAEAALFKLYITWDRAGDNRPIEDSIPKRFFQSFTQCVSDHMSFANSQ
jgi:hypothetical protein